MRLLFTFSFVLFFTTISIGQSFTLPELIKMSMMNLDDFDTYVSSKGFAFFEGKEDKNIKEVTYSYDLSEIDKTSASKWISFYQKCFDYKYFISYTTFNITEYLKIKDQIKQSGFKLTDSGVFKNSINGHSSNHFEYRKGKSIVSIYAESRGYEINYQVKN